MKKILLFVLFVISIGKANAQLTSLNETFDTTCDVTGILPVTSAWTNYSVVNSGAYWGCESQFGYAGTPCVRANGYYNNIYHPSEEYLITPKLDLSGYQDSVYFQFYSIYQYTGNPIQVMISTNYMGGNPDSSIYSWDDLSSSLTPVISTSADSNKFGIHKVNITAYKANPLNLAFKYTSTASQASRWSLDNVNTQSTQLSTSNINGSEGLNVTANGVIGAITLWYKANEADKYTLQIFDETGRKMYTSELLIGTSMQRKTFTDLHLSTGLYVIALTNRNKAKYIKVSVQ